MNREAVSILTTGAAPHALMAEGTYPFRVDPRLDPKPWGSRGLEQFGFPLPSGIPIGEALITAAEARALDGPGVDTQLGALVAGPARYRGSPGAEGNCQSASFPPPRQTHRRGR